MTAGKGTRGGRKTTANRKKIESDIEVDSTYENSDVEDIDENYEDAEEGNPTNTNSNTIAGLNEAIVAVQSCDDISNTLKTAFTAIMTSLSAGAGQNVTKVAKQVTQNKKNLDSLQTQVNRLELKMTENSVIIKNLPFKNNKNDSLYEKYEDTLSQASSLLGALKIDASVVKICDAKRFAPQKNRKGKALTPSTRVTLSNKSEVDLLLSKLPNLRNSKPFKNVQVQRELPQSLVQRNGVLQEEAYKLRRARKGRKTIISLKGTDLVLLVKEPNETKFEEHEV